MQQILPIIAGCATVLLTVGTVLAAQAPTRTVVKSDEGQIEILVQGAGPLVILLPSPGRGADDFDPIAVRLAESGYRVVRPQLRDIGKSQAVVGIDPYDYAADVAAVIEQERLGPAFVVGHGFGNRVARVLATERPELVSAVALIAGKVPGLPQVREAIRHSADPALSDAGHLKPPELAFFVPGNETRWHRGWHADVLAAERVAGGRTSYAEYLAAGRAPILYLQPGHDRFAPVEDAQAYWRQFGNRVTVVVIENASHAIIAEQPEAVSAALIDYARKIWPLTTGQ